MQIALSVVLDHPSSMPDVPRGHSCECLCATCEAQGGGYFAQLAALRGEPEAAERLSSAVFAALTAKQRGAQRNG